jgi:hypothetical protein
MITITVEIHVALAKKLCCTHRSYLNCVFTLNRNYTFKIMTIVCFKLCEVDLIK